MPTRLCTALILSVVVFGAGSDAAAQQPNPRKVSFGLLAGLNVSTMSTGDESLQASWPEEGLANYTAGGFALMNLSERLSLRAELLYSGKGSTGSIQDANGTWTMLTDRLHYLAVPILMRIAFKPVTAAKLTPYVMAGPELGVKLKASQTADIGAVGQEMITRSLSPFVKSTDVGVAFGGGVEYKRVIVEGRYTLGLTNVSADASLPSAKNRAFAVIFGMRF